MINRSASLRKEIRENMVGGKGSAALTHLLEIDDFAGKGRLFSVISLEPGSSVGKHEHKGDFEVYYILRGKGLADDNGTFEEVTEGDVIITKNGEFHSIENIGDTILDMVALILFD